jgi:hypothetical protein
MTGFNLSAAEIGRLDGGGVVSRTLEVKHRREIATLGIVRINTSPASYVERLTDITTFKRTSDVLQVGTFSSPPQREDVAALIIDEAELKRCASVAWRLRRPAVRGRESNASVATSTGARPTPRATRACCCAACSSTMSPAIARAARRRRWSTPIARRD